MAASGGFRIKGGLCPQGPQRFGFDEMDLSVDFIYEQILKYCETAYDASRDLLCDTPFLKVLYDVLCETNLY